MCSCLGENPKSLSNPKKCDFTFPRFFFFLLSDDNEGSSSDTAPLFQMAGDGRSTDDVTLPILFLFHKEGNILLEALKEHSEVEVLLNEKARDRGELRHNVLPLNIKQ